MAYIYKSESEPDLCGCRLHRCTHDQVVDVFKLAAMGEKKSRLDWAEYEETHPYPGGRQSPWRVMLGLAAGC